MPGNAFYSNKVAGKVFEIYAHGLKEVALMCRFRVTKKCSLEICGMETTSNMRNYN